MSNLAKAKAGFGTAPVFFTAISTILGAVMFLRFGYAVGSLGFLGTVVIVVIGHLVTIPTAMAIAEIATNQKVEGGGEYFIISRSFGFNVGGSIGIALFLSQTISVSFYIIAFGEAFGPVLDFLNSSYDLGLNDKRIITLPATFMLGTLILVKGADLGIKALYVVVAVLFLSLLMFFFGPGTEEAVSLTFDPLRHITDSDSFFYVFAIIFPAFTGMTAGVGLSGDLKDPKKSIPWGTLMATFSGMVIYIFIAYKLASSAESQELVDDQLIMSKIALWAPIIPIGLACATISSALGSILVAPRTLQALSMDRIFPNTIINRFLSKGKGETGEPVNATVVTLALAIFFVSIGDVNFVAEIISMFFMVTYGAICSISFLQHFAADPSYRPSFRSKWYISLVGAVMCIYLMFQMNAPYAFSSLLIMTITYLGITYSKKDKQGLVKITQGVIFQLSRRLQVFLQKAEKESSDNWRPTVICISKDTFERLAASELMRWVSHKYGFGTYIHFINGYFSRESNRQAKDLLERLIKASDVSKSNVYVDTMISPSYTTAVAQALQLPSVSGKESNMFLFEYSKHEPDNLTDIVENIPLVNAAEFDICILGSCQKDFGYRRQIHIWITSNDYQNANLMILMGYIIIGHPDWASAQIKIFAVFPEEEISEQKEKLLELIKEGRLPISANNVQLITQKDQVRVKEIISQKSIDADLTIVGMREEMIKQKGKDIFLGYDSIGNILFVNAQSHKSIN